MDNNSLPHNARVVETGEFGPTYPGFGDLFRQKQPTDLGDPQQDTAGYHRGDGVYGLGDSQVPVAAKEQHPVPKGAWVVESRPVPPELAAGVSRIVSIN